MRERRVGGDKMRVRALRNRFVAMAVNRDGSLTSLIVSCGLLEDAVLGF